MSSINLKITGGVAEITLNYPTPANRLTDDMAADFAQTCLQVNQDDNIRVVVLRASGKDFCAGADFDPARYHPAAAVAGIDRPVIAELRGVVDGEGLEIALACDLRLADNSAIFSLSQLNEGRLPSDGATQRLPRTIGKAKALEMLFSAAPVPAPEALEIGLINRLCSDVKKEVDILAVALATKGPIASRFLKEAVNKGMDLTLEQGIRMEEDLYFLLHTTADRTEGIRAFLEKRSPEFKGR